VTDAASLLDLRDIVKDYQALRPLRIRALSVRAGEVISLGGLDAQAAEIFVHLITGAMLPDEGEIALFGQNTRSIPDGDAWLRSLDNVGIVSGRSVLIEAFTVLQNVAMPFSLDVDPINPAVLPHATAVAREAGLDSAAWDRPVGGASAETQLRAHLARALALAPKLLIAEHPTATLPRDAVGAFGKDLGRIIRSRGIALVALTADDAFAEALGGQRLVLNGATGDWKTAGVLERFKKALRIANRE
jgi:predicted ABC-type transport system involved in lysophospholipase L1 biosynthesis ATPase subunit